MALKASIPKGTRDFLPTEVAKRNYVTGVIRTQFERYGYLPIETPAMEKSSTLKGKYGQEGDRLMFNILNSGVKVKKADINAFENNAFSQFISSISEKSLRYDLTVPFARFVVQHYNEINLPFRRYQIQTVWRGDRPQRGRFQEFTQCDADVVGAVSPLLEAECMQLFDDIFDDLSLKGSTIRINHRGILAGIANYLDEPDRIVDFTVALDKLDKIGAEGVYNELRGKGFDEAALKRLNPLLEISGNVLTQLDELEQILALQPEALEGIAQLRKTLGFLNPFKVSKLAFDLTLARGLHYYTGIIFEVAPPKSVSMGSIGAGGRYDDLTAVFGLKDVHGLGISFGLDRLCIVLEDLNLFPTSLSQSVDIVVLNFGDEFMQDLIPYFTKWRDMGIRINCYPTAHKLKKQMQFANCTNAPFVMFYGNDEQQKGVISIKNMREGKNNFIKLKDFSKKSIIKILKK
ncbi:MAG: histidine--tRNA ligase [Flavobacteriaceae bacterium]|jgi:histidyl-tRNA synthetase|nr:histidine--tRNA ligase [Flavobacteriaceae bacterium]|tara:strand:- start:2731 stop:4113 length:1383 start_codon:yes stop_codon:yes gene_type:complete